MVQKKGYILIVVKILEGISNSFGAPDRNRTGMILLSLDFESNASTNSTTGAFLYK